MTDNLTFPDIERGLAEVTADLEVYIADYEAVAVEAIGNPEMAGELTEALVKVDQAREAVKAYLKAEVDKCDSTHAWLKSMERLIASAHDESIRIWEVMKVRQAAVDYVKKVYVDVLREAGKKMVIGTRGRLRRQGNGGKRPVEIRQLELLPAKFRRVTITMSVEELQDLCDLLSQTNHVSPRFIRDRAKPTDPDTEAIRQELEMLDPCPAGCDDGRFSEGAGGGSFCECCGGSGTVPRGVPGAVLLERGEHLRCD